MIVYREWRSQWIKTAASGHYYCYEGWFLLGFIPLYIRRTTIR